MGEKHRNMPFVPRGGWRMPTNDSSEEIATRLQTIRDRDRRIRELLSEDGISIGNRPLTMFLQGRIR